ncbi:type II toxin-antitoxin system HicB family antitoxin [Brytella acorum]|uniref:Type II toxin-antitoxin system HicB family antitoxin n=1 Tax=Brytella acorum TaxID=2959299 RepID=A0AA35XVA4_9PROT|nr:type II toxin-antitoxin system HicB family antitoxin [Brytella acorum]CAI9119550.1 type II toxin-antitoxin system HicB family antitoxin [Brytella acorum]
MNNVMTIGGHRAVIQYDPEIKLFRGEFVGLNGGADFYADSIQGLEQEGETSLRVFLRTCEQDGVDPIRHYSGKFQVRVPEEVHAKAVETAAAKGISLNQFVLEAIEAAE